MSTPVLSVLPLLLGLMSALRVPAPLSDRAASYRIEARLDGPARELNGKQTLTWRNTGNGPVRELLFHLYMNAFKNDGSTFFREQSERKRPAVEGHRWGQIRVMRTRTRLGHGGWREAPLTTAPSGDQTLGRLRLEAPLAPGESLEVELEFTTRLPAIVSRTGNVGGFYAVAQWFPKIAVFECRPACGFREDVFHANGEFYADFGNYDVALDLPSGLVVGATGVLVEEQPRGERQLLRFHAEDVHDFVFTADARFVAHERLVMDDPRLPPVRVVLLGDPRLHAHVERHLHAAEIGLLELGRRLGAYPYSQLTIVQVPADADEAGGMEYPTLLFTDDERAPSWWYLPELVTAHELAHQWFQGILASDEVNEAWLDEGLTELATGWVLQKLAPPVALISRALGHQLTYLDAERVMLAGERSDPISQPSYAFRDMHAYAELTYRKTSLLLATIAARMGEPDFERALRGYADAHRFSHPHAADLLAAFAAAPAPLRTLLAEGLTRPGAVDYAVSSAKTLPNRPAEGLFDTDGGTSEVRDPSPDGSHHLSITVEELGEHRLPLTVRAHLRDGSHVDQRIFDDADPRHWRRVELDAPSPLVEATLYPEGDTPIDVRRWNDGRRVQPDAAPRRTLTTSLQLLLSLALSWVGR